MKHTLFVLFDDEKQASEAISALAREGIPEDGFSVIVHRDTLHPSDLHLEETDARGGLLNGLAAGATLGALAGVLVGGPLGLLGIGPTAAAVFGAGAGSLYGLFAGGLAGASCPDPVLRRLADAVERGQVLVTVDVEGALHADRAEEILEAHGGHVVHKPLG